MIKRNTEEISFEQYIEKNKESLFKEFKNLSDEDFILIRARNPEDPKQVVEWNLHKYQYERLHNDSIELRVPEEELVFISLMYTLEASEMVSVEEKQKIRMFLDRQMKRIKNNVNKILVENIKNVTIMQLQIKLNQLKSIPMERLNNMEKLWREQFKKDKISDYKDEDVYVKIKFAELL